MMLTPFKSYLKQIDTGTAVPILQQLFSLAFPEFEAETRLEQTLQEQGVKYVHTPSGLRVVEGARARRLAGGTDLPRGRYYTVAKDIHGFDGGTLVNELYAYYRGRHGLGALVLDAQLETPEAERWLGVKRAYSDYSSLALHVCFENLANDPEVKRLFGVLEQTVRFDTYYFHKCKEHAFDRVIDLRLPETRRAFAAHFAKLESEGEDEAARESTLRMTKGKFEGSPSDFIKLLLDPQTGGASSLGQAIGLWCRQNGVDGIVFPSARSNAYALMRDGVLVESAGWNFVCYKGAEPNAKRPTFGYLPSWRAGKDLSYIRIHEEENGPERGSIWFRGMKERNLLQVIEDRLDALCGPSEARLTRQIRGQEREIFARAASQMLDEQDKAPRGFRHTDLKATIFLEGSGVFRADGAYDRASIRGARERAGAFSATSAPIAGAEEAPAQPALPAKKRPWWKLW